MTEGFGLYPTIVNPPYTTLTAYDLNQGTIKWQIGLGDDLRLVGQGIKGTGTAATIKGGIIPTATGLLFVTAADRKVHVYDSTSGKQLWELPLGATTSGSPSMYELDGRQYLLVTASAAAGRAAGVAAPTPALLPPQDRPGSWPTRCPGTDIDAPQSPFRYDRAMGHKRRTRAHGVFREHSLSLTVIAIMAVWFVLYVRGDPSTHLGSFYGNALADWLGTFAHRHRDQVLLRNRIRGKPAPAPQVARTRRARPRRSLADDPARHHGSGVGCLLRADGSGRQGRPGGRQRRV